jgi:hypothetical protein
MRKIPYSLVSAIFVITILTPFSLFPQQVKHQQYKVVILPPDGGPDSYLAGYLYYAPLTDHGTLGVAADINTGYNSYT